jgi:alpha-ketoglutarate-dependent taurine dioxygenase
MSSKEELEQEIFNQEEFKTALASLPEKDRDKALASLREYIELFHTKIILPLKSL